MSPSRSPEGDLGLDHPELGRVPRGVRILRPEGGAEGVDVRKGAGEGLALKLAAHGEVGGLSEKLVGTAPDFLPVHRHDAEHLARALAVRGGDDGRVHVDEAALLEETVDRVGHAAADAEDRSEEVRPRAEVGDGAHELHRVTFLLERIILGRRSDEDDAAGLQFPALALTLRLDDGPLDLERGPGAGRDDRSHSREGSRRRRPGDWRGNSRR